MEVPIPADEYPSIQYPPRGTAHKGTSGTPIPHSPIASRFTFFPYLSYSMIIFLQVCLFISESIDIENIRIYSEYPH